MSYINFINSANSSINPFYKPLAEPTITSKDGSKFVKASIEWNGKSYLFTWRCSETESDANINKELVQRINTMLALGVRYGLGKKITSLKYNFNDDTVERTPKNPAKAPTSTKVDFDQKMHHYDDKLSKAKAAESSQPEENHQNPKNTKKNKK